MITIFFEEAINKIDDLLVNQELQNGHNGPYKDEETDVRKISHLLVLYANALKSGLDIEARLKIEELKEALINSEYYKGKAYFKSRNKPGKDEVNGVIGIAWVMEGLCAAYEVLKEEKILIFLENIVESLNFNKERGLWERPTHLVTDKSGIDETFNHQLWLAYAIIYYFKVANKEVSDDVKEFFIKLDVNLRIHKEGLIVHSLKNRIGLKNKLKDLLKSIKVYVKSRIKGTTTKYKENGYHLFNMFAFSRIESLGYGYLFKDSRKIRKALIYSSGDHLYNELSSNLEETDYYSIALSSCLNYNRYGFPYNVSGFEFLYVNKIFNLKKDVLANKYFKKQKEVYGYKDEKNKFVEKMKTEDEINLLLRVYELSFCLVD
ncbi:hypothetical protein BTO06_02945 [Tenacibaculum sp. SZ-18]|uniref:hypothetical protein n=1 Tax=Tenacibaculum sp. SZ-18 TaxID=754423 RepID=UPI000C2D3589|nr:hypothetical protein [Tenacibaculum sp. SZ-18]AUC14168.1 hypothetical protein BTO06_02945 [Tenacibaculum sp. SZ-18]